MTIDALLKTIEEEHKELQQYRAIGTVDECAEMQVQYNYLSTKIKKYEAIGTVEEVKEAKEQFDNINSIAEKTALIGLCGYATAKEAVITEIKRSLDYSLKEYQSIGTVEEFKALKEKNVAKKPLFIKRSFTQFYACPHCSTNEHYEKVFSKMKHCENCGGAFDWE